MVLALRLWLNGHSFHILNVDQMLDGDNLCKHCSRRTIPHFRKFYSALHRRAIEAVPLKEILDHNRRKNARMLRSTLRVNVDLKSRDSLALLLKNRNDIHRGATC